jgi:hypothetical protein
MPRTTNKGVRFTAAELAHIEHLRMQLPEYTSDADLLRHAALLGVLVLATQATRPGMTPYAGYGAEDLAALLKPRILPALDFLVANDAMPSIGVAPRLAQRTAAELRAPDGASRSPDSGLRAPDSESGEVTTIEGAASGELHGLGTGMMDD